MRTTTILVASFFAIVWAGAPASVLAQAQQKQESTTKPATAPGVKRPPKAATLSSNECLGLGAEIDKDTNCSTGKTCRTRIGVERTQCITKID